MRRKAILFVLLALAPTVAPAQEAPPLERELAGIRAALEEIATLMRQQLAASNRDTVLRRIEIKNARLVPIESALRGVREQLQNFEAERARMETRAQELEETLFYSEDEEAKSQARKEQKGMLAFAEQLREMVAAAQAREMEVERERNALLAEIDELERRLDERPR
ncbi:MAG TPA: hypothetical protein VMV46_07045 [Thermoanaerobaculia bacterium]|nr:hypothetical protein [Thermoanaerobaculia bacterium]